MGRLDEIGDFRVYHIHHQKCHEKNHNSWVFAGRFVSCFFLSKIDSSGKRSPPTFQNCGLDEVQRYLLASIGFWMNQFGMDGFRFLDVASMIYLDRGRWDRFFFLVGWGNCGWGLWVGRLLDFFFISGFEI